MITETRKKLKRRKNRKAEQSGNLPVCSWCGTSRFSFELYGSFIITS